MKKFLSFIFVLNFVIIGWGSSLAFGSNAETMTGDILLWPIFKPLETAGKIMRLPQNISDKNQRKRIGKIIINLISKDKKNKTEGILVALNNNYRLLSKDIYFDIECSDNYRSIHLYRANLIPLVAPSTSEESSSFFIPFNEVTTKDLFLEGLMYPKRNFCYLSFSGTVIEKEYESYSHGIITNPDEVSRAKKHIKNLHFHFEISFKDEFVFHNRSDFFDLSSENYLSKDNELIEDLTYSIGSTL